MNEAFERKLAQILGIDPDNPTEEWEEGVRVI